jgi:L,D-transpeptidase catalytic domain/Putative peptidoglycan binding domain
MRRLTALLALLALLVLAPGAVGQSEDPLPEPELPEETAPTPKLKPKDGKLTLAFRNGLRREGRVYLAKGQRVKIRGRARPFVPGQRVRVELRRKGKTVAAKTRRLRKAGRNRGQFVLRFKAREKGGYVVRARHKRTRRQRAFSARKGARVVDNTAAVGSRGIRVRMLQRGLRRLGYAGLAPTGYFGPGTARAVLAFRKVNHLARTGYASWLVYKKVFEGRGTFRLKYPRAGKHVEADLSRQVLVLARNGRAERIYHMSSGKASTPTVLGSFRVYRKSPGTNSHGMVHSSYFIGGYAIHGYPSVPTYPASHGCLRVPIPSAWSIYSWIDFGDKVFVYR